MVRESHQPNKATLLDLSIHMVWAAPQLGSKGSGSKGPGKSTALTGKKAKSKKAQAAFERYKSGQAEDADDLAAKKKRQEDAAKLKAARKKMLGK